jgi:hypothetical protein
MINLLLKSLPSVALIALFACNSGNKYSPDKYLSKEEQASLIQQSVHYSAKLAPQATHETKFNGEFDWYYDVAAKEYDLRELYPADDNSYYFLMTRQARSIWPAREAIGGKLIVNKNNNLVDYDESFRTWKMTEDSLNERAFFLFDLMVKGEDLNPYRSKFKGDRYIEFPDDRYYYNTTENKWKDRIADSLNIKR